MFLALLLMMVGLALLMTSAAYVENENHRAQFDSAYTAASEAADNGMQRALLAMNKDDYPPLSSQPPATGTDADGSTWSYYGVPHGKLQTGDYTWTVYATGTMGTQKQTESATLALDPGLSSENVPWPDGLFGTQYVKLRIGVVTSYIAGVGLANDNGGSAGSNGVVSLGTGATVDEDDLWGWAANPNPGRCVAVTASTPGCPAASAAVSGQETNLADPSNGEFVNQFVNQCTGGWTPWTASANGGVLTPGVHCFSSMDFDQNTTVQGTPMYLSDGSPGNPTIVLVAGPVTVEDGVKVNTASAFRDSTNFYLYGTSTAQSLTMKATTTAVNFTGAVSMPNATCTFTTTGAAIDYYGALACLNITNPNTNASNFYIDEFGAPAYEAVAAGEAGKIAWHIQDHNLIGG